MFEESNEYVPLLSRIKDMETKEKKIGIMSLIMLSICSYVSYSFLEYRHNTLFS